MVVSFNRAELLKAIKTASRFVSEMSSNPALSGICFETANGQLQIRSTGPVAAFKSVIPSAKIKDPEGSFLMKASFLNAVVPKVKSGEIEFSSVEGDKVVISAGTYFLEASTLDIASFPADDFTYDGWNVYETDGTLWSEIAVSIAPCVLRDPSKNSAFTGINLIQSGNKMRAVATDTMKFATNVFPLEGPDFNVTLDPLTLEVVRDAVLESKNVKVVFAIKGQQVIFGIGDSVLRAGTLESKFPPIDRILEVGTQYAVPVLREALIDILERGLAIGNPRAQIVSIDLGSGHVSFSFKSTGIASSIEKIDTEINPEKPISVKVNAHHLLSVVQSASQPSLTLALNGQDRPVKILQSDKPDYSGVVVHVLSK